MILDWDIFSLGNMKIVSLRNYFNPHPFKRQKPHKKQAHPTTTKQNTHTKLQP